MSKLPPHSPAIDEQIERASEQIVSSPGEAVALAGQVLATLEVRDALGAGGEPVQIVRALRVRGLAHHHLGRHAAGLADLNRALAATPAGDPALRADVLYALAVGYNQMGALDEALDWSRQALEAAREVGDPELIADAQLSVGVSFSRCGDTEAALAHYRAVLAFHERVGDARRCARVLNNVGIALKNLARYDESAAHLERGLALLDAPGDEMLRATLRSNLGETLLLMGRPEAAREVLVVAVEAMQRAGRADPESETRIALARVLAALGQPGAAQAELEHALKLLGDTGTRLYVARAHQTLADLHKAAGRFEAALRHHEAYHAAERAQFNEESERKRTALRSRLDVAEARHEAELHQLKHVQIAKAHAELQALHAALLEADTEKNALLARLAEQGRTDALTGLANRRQLDEWLATELARARRHGLPLTVAMCDLDHFKTINDDFGHATGDAVLRVVAGLLRERCRATDLVARYGGEEFCIAFPQTDAVAGARACEALREAVARHDWSAIAADLTVTLSIGLSDALDVANHERLLADADAQLYRAKREGRNRVCHRP